MKRFVWLIFVLATSFLTSPVWGEEEDVDTEEIEVAEEEDVVVDEETDSDVLGEEEDVTTVAYWPNGNIVVGQEATVLVSFSNNGESAINITHIGAHLHSPYDYSFFIQNFSVRAVGAVVEAKQEVSLEYVFRPDKTLEPSEYWLSGWLVYNDSNDRQYMRAYHNTTIELSEAASSSLIDLQQVFLVATLGGLFAMAFFGVTNYVNQGKKKRTSRPATATTERSDGEPKLDSSWDPVIYKQAPKSQAANKRKSDRKPKKGSKESGKHSAKDSTNEEE
jgi:hypothetical protein